MNYQIFLWNCDVKLLFTFEASTYGAKLKIQISRESQNPACEIQQHFSLNILKKFVQVFHQKFSNDKHEYLAKWRDMMIF